MGSDEGHGVSRQWSQWRAETDLHEYFTRWQRLEASGQSSHGEADFIQSWQPGSVLDAGCGMGRVAIELDRRGIDVVGVDLDDDLFGIRTTLATLDPMGDLADLATMSLGRSFGVVAMPGNVMIFCRPSDRAAIIDRVAAHIEPAGLLIAGFDLQQAPMRSLSRSTTGCVLRADSRWCSDHRPGKATHTTAAAMRCRFTAESSQHDGAACT